MREQWDLGDPFTARDAAARTFSSVFTLDTPRDPKTWPVPKARPVPPMQQDMAALGAVLSVMGKTMLQGIREYAAEHNLEIEGLPKDPKAAIPDDQVVNVIRGFLANWFPLLASSQAKKRPAARSAPERQPLSEASERDVIPPDSPRRVRQSAQAPPVGPSGSAAVGRNARS